MITPSLAHLTSDQRKICLAAGMFCIVAGLTQQFLLWQLEPNGLSPIGDRLPYWDFSNLWGGSAIALHGHVADLFDVRAYRDGLDTLFGVSLPPQEWSYPPNILLIGVPLALLPIGAAYVLWSGATLALFHLALRPFRLPPAAHFFVLLSPAIWDNQVFGQNGALTAALLVGGLYLAPSRPVLAGILLGLLTIKPHLGILIPFCLLASRNARAIVSATATAAIMVLATGLLFGFDVWLLFLTETRALMTRIMEAPYPQAYHQHAMTAFVTARSLGAGVSTAYAAQGVATLLAVAAATWLWRPASRVDHRSRVALTGLLVIIATPYGYSHDTAPAYLAIAWFLLTDDRPNLSVYVTAWVFALFFPLFTPYIAIGMAAPLFLSTYVLARHPNMRPAQKLATPRLADMPTPGRS